MEILVFIVIVLLVVFGAVLLRKGSVSVAEEHFEKKDLCNKENIKKEILRLENRAGVYFVKYENYSKGDSLAWRALKSDCYIDRYQDKACLLKWDFYISGRHVTNIKVTADFYFEKLPCKWVY